MSLLVRSTACLDADASCSPRRITTPSISMPRFEVTVVFQNISPVGFPRNWWNWPQIRPRRFKHIPSASESIHT